MYFYDIFYRLLGCFAFQTHIQNRWAMQHRRIIIYRKHSMQEVKLFYLLQAFVSHLHNIIYIMF